VCVGGVRFPNGSKNGTLVGPCEASQGLEDMTTVLTLDDFEYIKIWYTPLNKLKFWDGAPQFLTVICNVVYNSTLSFVFSFGIFNIVNLF